MRKIIEELWYGNVDFFGGEQKPTQKEKELLEYIEKHRRKLVQTLTNEGKGIFDKFIDCSDELKELNEKEIFEYAFCLGARIVIEVMCFKTE